MVIRNRVGPLFRHGSLSNKLIIGDRVVFLSRERLRRGLRESIKSIGSICIAVISGDGIPFDGVLNVFGATNANLGVVAHGEFG
jgi:hypothetical protein